MLAVGVVLLAGCGSSGSTVADRARPPVPTNLTVYIDNGRVSVSPDSVGAGQVTFTVTNRADRAQSLQVLPSDQSAPPLASTGPINPYATAQVSVDFPGAGEYLVSTGTAAATDAALSSPSSVRPARLHVGKSRPAGGDNLLLP